MPDVFLFFANFRIDFCFSFNRIGRHKNRDQLCLFVIGWETRSLFVCLLAWFDEIPTKFSFFSSIFSDKISWKLFRHNLVAFRLSCYDDHDLTKNSQKKWIVPSNYYFNTTKTLKGGEKWMKIVIIDDMDRWINW